MKLFYAALLLAVSGSALAQEFFSGKVDDIYVVGQRIVIDGEEYRFSGDTKIIVSGKLISVYALREGHPVEYALDYQATGQKKIRAIKLLISEEEAAQYLNH